MKNKKSVFLYIITQVILLFISVLLYFLPHPNFINKNGFPILAWITYLPVLFLIRRSKYKDVWFWGGLYGVFSILFFAYWLKNYDEICLYLMMGFYFVIYSILFFVLRLCDVHFKRTFWIVQFFVICAFEYLKTIGFAGFNYGIIAYSQWQNIKLIQICDIVGVFGLNLLIIFFSCLIYGFLVLYIEEKIKYVRFSIYFLVWIICLASTLIYGHLSVRDYSSYKQTKIAAIQNNEDPTQNGLLVAKNNIQSLIDLTNEAIDISPDIDIVLWPETSVLPAIQYHYTQKKDNTRYLIVNSILQFINKKNQTFVIGNGHIKTDNNDNILGTYNSALVFYPQKNVIPPNPLVYSKVHLVPYSEHFPYKEKLPFLYNLIVKDESLFWDAGKEYVCFTDVNSQNIDFNFSVPICFEDTFSKTGREMYKNGARAFLNMSNDAWSKSESCQYQHLAMAVFRSVENRVPSVRSTSSGQTCSIDPNGIITNMAQPFSKTYIVTSIPTIEQNRKMTVYCKVGDICGNGSVILALVLLLSKIIIVIIKRVKAHNNKI